MHGRPHSHFRGFQIQPAVLMPVLQDHLQQTAYLARHFLLDRFGRFFSCRVMVSSRGCSWQIFSLMAISS
jgi:hypothetical protein